MIKVPEVVLDAWVARLADKTNGFNPRLKATFAPDDAYEIDFTGQSGTFFKGDVGNIADVISSSNVDFPFMLIDVTAGSNARAGQHLKFHEFSGTLTGVCKVAIEYGQLDVMQDFSIGPHNTINAMYQTMNSMSVQQPLAFPNGIRYSGDLNFNVSPAARGAKAWIRVVTFTAMFKLDVQ